MKAIMVMYDSLNRHLLETYGCDWTITPNFKRLAEKAVQFNHAYSGSLPCMPARRELHTGRMNFLHRSWGPIEPYDDSMPQILKQNGIYTHLISDHQHYWEDGGSTYHERYSSWEISRGQEGDPWKVYLEQEVNMNTVFEGKRVMYQSPFMKPWVQRDQMNRTYMDSEEKTPQAVTFNNGLDFIDTNHNADNWFLQIETFDPHEPFFVTEEYKKLFPHKFIGDDVEFDWPPYYPVKENQDVIDAVRAQYAALLAKCDDYLGRVLDKMDEYDLWKDTMLIVNTDHGFLLGEHGWWGKGAMPYYDELVHIPFYIYDPRHPECHGPRNSLVQTIDIAPTILRYFGQEIPKDMTGFDLEETIVSDMAVRDYAVWGVHSSSGGDIGITDGRYVLMQMPEDRDVQAYEYTLIPTHMRAIFSPKELQNIELAEPFSFTKGCRLMKIAVPAAPGGLKNAKQTGLYDLENDPTESSPITDPEVFARFKADLSEFFKANDAPEELYQRYGIAR